MLEAQVINAQNAQADTYLGTDGIQVRIESFLGNAEIRHPYRHDTIFTPHK